MAVNVIVYDLDNYPDNAKTITVDQKTVVPIGGEGDEKWVLSFVTTAYSDNTARTAIQDIYVQEIKAGWLKSSGFVGAGGKFTIGASSKQLEITLDAGVGYAITLTEGVNLSGDVIAADMETKIRALTVAAAYELAYMNCSVEYKDGKFWIISGSVSPYYTGASRSSVKVDQAAGDTCYQVLGFNLPIDSQTIAVSIKEAMLAVNYTTNTSPLVIGTGTGVAAGDCMMITDGTNTDYFAVLSGTETSVEVAISGVHGYTGIANSYTTSGTKVQVLREQDPDQVPAAYYDVVDSITRWGIKSIANQIDYTS